MIDFTQLANIMNKDLRDVIKVQIYERAPMWQIFGGFQADEDGFAEGRVYDGTTPQIEFKNNLIYTTIQTGRPSGTSIPVGGTFLYGETPTAQGVLGMSTPVQAFILPKAVMNVKNEGSIVNTVQFNMDAHVNAMAMKLNRQCYRDGNAVLAYTAASNPGSGFTINLAPKATGATFYNGDIPLGERFFEGSSATGIGTYIKIGANTPTYVTATGQNSITVADSQTVVASTAIVKLDGSGATASEFQGLDAMISSSVYQGIDPATTSSWQPSIYDGNSGAAKAFAKGDWNKAYTTVNVYGKVKFLACNISEFDAYGNSLTDLVRFQKNDILAGGWNGLDFMAGNAKILMDNDCPDDKVYFISPEDLMRAEFQPLEWEPGTMNNGQRITQTLNYEMVCDLMGNLSCDKRRAQGALYNRVG